jgi:alpha-mannosidase
VDQGYQEFALVVRPHVGDWRDSRIVETARALNLPVVPITMHGHPGSLPGQASLLALSSPDMELAALKTAEDGDGWIARVVDRHGRGSVGDLTWQGAGFPLALAPFEVATLRLTLTPGGPRCAATDMLERSQG